MMISIHALTKSAIFGESVVSTRSPISIHALTKSAMLIRLRIGIRCDISIHALTKSAIRHCYKMPSSTGYFNPRTHEECDEIALLDNVCV